MIFCKKCVQPDTRPSIVFDAEGVCPACRFAEDAPAIDWAERRREIDAIADFGRRNNVSGYDCIVGVSGGKDSLRQAMYVRDELHLKPLLVCCSYPPEQLTERGARNLSNLIGLGFDTISVSPAPQVWKKLMREGFLRYGNWAKSTEMALYASAPKVAIAYHIPLVFLGENPAITVGELGVGSTTGDANRMKYCHTLSGGPEALMDGSISEREVLWYRYSSDEELEMGDLRVVYLGYYIPGFTKRGNAEYSMAHGMEVRDESPEDIGDLTGHEALDDDFVIINQMMKYLKFGFGKVSDQVCEEIRLGRMTRDEAIALVKRYDGKCADRYIRRFCNYLDITEQQFWEVAERFRDKTIWERAPDETWQLKTAIGATAGRA